MYQYSNMLLLGSSGRNTGKTEFACRLIRKYRQQETVIGLKITTIDSSSRPCPRGKDGCGVCTAFSGKFQLTEETNGPAGKDTVRMLNAGAHRVFWLKVRADHLDEGVSALKQHLGNNSCVICESNSCRRVLNPGMFLVMRKHGSSLIKKTCRDVIHEADKILKFHGTGWDLDFNRFRFSNGKWTFAEPATAIVLAGGRSRRMGSDKSLLPLSGKPMIEVIIDQLRDNFKQILVSSSASKKYEFLNIPVVPDLRLGMGPLMGILSALERSESDLNFVTSCDAPNIKLSYVRQLLKEAETHDLVIPISENGRFEPLFAVYRKSVISHCHDLLANGHRKISDLFERVNVKYLPFNGADWYENLNTTREFENYKNQYLREHLSNRMTIPSTMTG